MVTVKALDVLIEACANAAAVSDFHLYLVGDGPLRSRIEGRIAELGLRGRISCVGYVAHDDLADWYVPSMSRCSRRNQKASPTCCSSRSRAVRRLSHRTSAASRKSLIRSSIGSCRREMPRLLPTLWWLRSRHPADYPAGQCQCPIRSRPRGSERSWSQPWRRGFRAAPRDLRAVGAAEAQP